MVTTLFLVRHAIHDLVAQTLVGRMAEVRLNREGRGQAERLASWFAAKGITLVQSSPRERARDTAEPIAAAAGLALDVVPALDEIDVGEWTGCSFEALKADPRWQLWNGSRSLARAPGGETMLEVQSRVVGHIRSLHAVVPHGRAVLVSHCDVIKAALLHFLGRPVDDYARLDIAPGSVSTLKLDRGSAEVLALNERSAP